MIARALVDADVLEHGLSPVIVAERRECLALHIVGDAQQRPAALCDTLEHRKQIFHARDLLFMDENVRATDNPRSNSTRRLNSHVFEEEVLLSAPEADVDDDVPLTISAAWNASRQSCC